MNKLLVYTLLFLAPTLVHSEGAFYPVAPFSDPRSFKHGEWEYIVYYLNKGKKEESISGYLLYKKEHVPEAIIPKYIKTPFGEMTFLPAPKTLDRPNMVIGWVNREYSKIPWTISNPPVFPKRNDWWEMMSDRGDR